MILLAKLAETCVDNSALNCSVDMTLVWKILPVNSFKKRINNIITNSGSDYSTLPFSI